MLLLLRVEMRDSGDLTWAVRRSLRLPSDLSDGEGESSYFQDIRDRQILCVLAAVLFVGGEMD